MEKKRKAIEGAIKETLARMLPREARYRLLHHESKSSFDLQIVDYVNWAIYRKWERGELRSYDLIRPAVRQEIELLPRLAWLLSLVKGSGLLP